MVESNVKPHLAVAISLRMTDGKKLAHYLVQGGLMRLFWHKDGNDGTKEGKAIPLPYPMDAEALTEFTWGWLKEAPRGNEPDMDGSVYSDGFRVDTEGSYNFWSYETFSVKAVWTEFHK